MDSCLRQKESTLSSSGGWMRYFERDPNIISARTKLLEDREERIRKDIHRFLQLKKINTNKVTKGELLKLFNPEFESMNF